MSCEYKCSVSTAQAYSITHEQAGSIKLLLSEENLKIF